MKLQKIFDVAKKHITKHIFLRIVKIQRKCGQVLTQLSIQNRPLILAQTALNRLLMET